MQTAINLLEIVRRDMNLQASRLLNVPANVPEGLLPPLAQRRLAQCISDLETVESRCRALQGELEQAMKPKDPLALA